MVRGYAGDMSAPDDHAPGLHLILDLYGVSELEDEAAIDAALTGAAKAAGATVLAHHFHHFGTGHGVTGVVLLAESHMSIHTWPERGYAAIDIFMCGRTDAQAAADHLVTLFAPERVVRTDLSRGQS